MYYDRFQSELFPEKRKIVFLTQILPTRDTVGYEQISNLVVKKFDGREILNLDQFAEAAAQRVSGYHKIEFEDDPHQIYLDANQVEQDAAQLQKIYSLPALQRL